MSSVSMYAMSKPVFLAMLSACETWLDKAENLAKSKNFDVNVLMQWRLYPDMLPFAAQIGVITAFAKNAMARLAGQTPPDFPDNESTVPELRARIARARDIVQSIAAKDFEGADEREISFKMGGNPLTMKGGDYLFKYIMPNLYFHSFIAYAILRQNGIDVHKRDFLPSLMS